MDNKDQYSANKIGGLWISEIVALVCVVIAILTISIHAFNQVSKGESFCSWCQPNTPVYVKGNK